MISGALSVAINLAMFIPAAGAALKPQVPHPQFNINPPRSGCSPITGAIDLYKLENGINQTTKQPKQQRSQGSAADMVSTKTTSVDAKQPKIWTEREIAAMSLDQFDKHRHVN